MKLLTEELNGKTYALVEDGKPVYEADGKRIAFDAPGTSDAIKRLNGEAKSHREAKEAAIEQLKAFEGLDASAAREAITKLSNIDQKKLIDAGEVDKVRSEIASSYQKQLDALKGENGTLKQTLNNEIIGGAFARSQIIADKLAIPADLVQARFGQHFKLDDTGKIIATDANGQTIYSKASPGQPASFDEALDQIVDAYPMKDKILAPNGQQGGGSQNGRPNQNSGAKTINRSTWDSMSQSERAAKSKDGFKVVD